MSKLGDLDWSELKKSDDDYTHEPTALWSAVPSCGVDPLNKAKPVNAPGEVPRKPSDEEISSYILKGMDDKSLGGWKDENHLHKEVVSQEQADRLQKNWENIFQDHFDQLNKPVEPQDQEQEWGNGKSFNDTLTEEERLRRNMFTDE